MATRNIDLPRYVPKTARGAAVPDELPTSDPHRVDISQLNGSPLGHPMAGHRPVDDATPAMADLLETTAEKPYRALGLRAHSLHDEVCVMATQRCERWVFGEGEPSKPPLSSHEYDGHTVALARLADDHADVSREIAVEEAPPQAPDKVTFHSLQVKACEAAAKARKVVKFAPEPGAPRSDAERYPEARVFTPEECGGAPVTADEAAGEVGTAAMSEDANALPESERNGWAHRVFGRPKSSASSGPKGFLAVLVTICLGVLLGASLGLAFGWLTPGSLQSSLVYALNPVNWFTAPPQPTKLVHDDPPVAPVLTLLLCLIGFCIATVSRCAVSVLFKVLGEASADRKIALAANRRSGLLSYCGVWAAAMAVLLGIVSSECGLEASTFHRLALVPEIKQYESNRRAWERAHGVSGAQSDDGEGVIRPAAATLAVKTPVELDRDLTDQVALFAAFLVLTGYLVMGAGQGFVGGRSARFASEIARKMPEMIAAREARRGLTPEVLAYAGQALSAYDGRRHLVNGLYARKAAIEQEMAMHRSRMRELEAAQDEANTEVKKELSKAAEEATAEFNTLVEMILAPAKAALTAEVAQIKAQEDAALACAQDKARIETEASRTELENARKTSGFLDQIAHELEVAIRSRNRTGLVHAVKNFFVSKPNDGDVKDLEAFVNRLIALRQELPATGKA